MPAIRRVIADYASACGIGGSQLDEVKLAVSEAVANVVLHAYRGGTGMVHFTARAVEDELWVLVADDGCGPNVAPVRPGLGKGLLIITATSEDFTLLERAEGGTEARMRFRIPQKGKRVRSADR